MRTCFFIKIFIVFVALLSVQTASAYDFMVDGLCYNKNGDGFSVTVTCQNPNSGSGNPGYYSNKLPSDLTIPSSVNFNDSTFTVTAIGVKAFHYCTWLTSVNIPNSVTYIESHAFWGCINLKSVTLGNSLTLIGDYAFYECNSLTSVTIPNSVTTIGSYAFCKCRKLTSLTMGNSVSSIGYWAFHFCDALTDVTWNAVNCKSTGQMTTINIDRVTIGEQVKTLPMSFVSGSKIAEVTIPNSVTTINSDAFSNCNALTDLTWNAVNCKSTGQMTTINIERVTIGEQVKVLPEYFVSGSKVMSVTIPNSVSKISQYAFFDCSTLTNITLGNSVSAIGDYAFQNDTDITDLSLPNTLTSIGSYAFKGCTGLTNLTIPNSVSTIGEQAYADCSGLTGGLTIPNSVTSIGANAFSGCSCLTEVCIPNSLTKINAGLFQGCNGLSNVVIPNTVSEIGNGAFMNCSGLVSIIIGNNVKSIEKSAFENCTSLKEIYFNALECVYNDCSVSVDNSDKPYVVCHPFLGCPVSKVVIGKSVQSLPNLFFLGFPSINVINIPASVKNIGHSPFAACDNLSKIKVETGNIVYDSRKNCNGIIETATNKLVVGCKSTVIPRDVDTIAACAFFGHSALNEIKIPNSVRSVRDSAFFGCGNLETLYLGTSLDDIADYAFPCPSLKAIYNARQRAAAINQEAFSKVDRNTCYLYVPDGYEQIYWANTEWNRFKHIETWIPPVESENAGDLNDDGNVNTGDVSELYKGILGGITSALYDINGDGSVNTGDISALYKFILGGDDGDDNVITNGSGPNNRVPAQ